ncbi:MAG: hypothetical protein IKM45_03445 [Opitutales bacterium]|nr:hypothetical protein [Opitutales bacterium]
MENNQSEIESVPADNEKPKKKCRWLRRILWVLLFVIILVLTIVAFFLGPIVKFGVNTFGASFLGVDKCSVESVKIYPFTGHVRFEKILVGKPVLYGSEFLHDIFSVDLIDVDADIFSLLTQKKVFDRVEILNPSATYEQLRSGIANVDVVLKNVLGEPKPDAEPVAGTQNETEDAEEPSEEIYIGARYFVIKDVRLAAYLRGMPMKFPPMSADFSQGIGMDENLTPLAFGTKVAGNFMSVIDVFRKSAIGDMTGAAMGAVSDAAVMAGDAAKSATDVAVSAVSGAAEFTGDAAKATTDAAVDVVSGAAEFTEDAVNATTDTISDSVDAVWNFFGSGEKDEKK